MINLRLALRSLGKTPLVTAAAVLSLALGIGANAAIFSIFERIILRSLPVQDPDRLVNFLSPGPKPGSKSSNNAGGPDAIFSYPMFRDLESSQAVTSAATMSSADTMSSTRSVFTGIAAHCTFGANLAYRGSSTGGDALLVSGSYFEVLGLRPALGRLFSREDDVDPGGHPLVVLSHAYWRSGFEARPSVTGETLVVNGQPMTIVGVAPRGFRGTTLGQDPRIFVPISMRAAMVPGWEGFENRRSYWIYLFARLEDGVSVDQAAAAVNVPYKALIRDVELALQTGSSERTLERFKNKEILLEAGRRGQSQMLQEARTPLLLLLGVTGFVLSIACANLANLLLIKATNRAGEIAVRMSIGARRFQVVAQLLAESFVLALAGSALGLLVAYGTLELFGSLLPADGGDALAFELGPAVWVFLGVLVAVTGLVGLFPAWHCTRHDLVLALKSQAAGHAAASKTDRRFRASMATLQIALSMALLIAAGLFVRSLVNVSRVDLGIRTEQIATFGLAPELNGYTPVESRAFFERVEDELQAYPGISDVTASMVPLITGNNWSSNVTVQGFPGGPDVDTDSRYNAVGPGYFRTLGIPLLAGRELERRDALGAPKVALVNEAFAEKFQLDRDAVGQRMQVGSGGELDIEIVGLVADAKYSDVKQAVPPTFFLPYRQDDQLGSIYFYVRSSMAPEEVMPALRQVVARLDADLPVANLRTMEAQVRENVVVDRMLSTLSASFAVLATLLAAIGLYGVLGYSVAQRTREIGLRMALGADAGRVRGLVFRQVGWMTLAGAAIGLLGALGLGRVAGSLLYGVEGHDPLAMTVSTAVLALVAFGAGCVPARRAASVDPIRALRDE